MEHEARNGGLHIHHQICNHRGERVIASYHVDGFCLKRNTAFQFHGCRWHGCLKCYPEKHQRDAVCMNAGKKKAILEAGFGRVLGTQFSQNANLSEKEKVKTFRHAIMYDIEAMLNAAKHQKVTDGLSEF